MAFAPLSKPQSKTPGPAKPVLQRKVAGGLLQRTCACGGRCEECGNKRRFGLQTKLKISEPGDAYEQEADRVADQVMATPANPSVSNAAPRIQRSVGPGAGHSETAPASVGRALAGSGRQLDPALRRGMEQRFGYDFSRVRVHSDRTAGESARDVKAHAYTVGHDIVFSAGQFVPGTHEGRRLIAHELTHAVQQGAVPKAGAQSPGPRISAAAEGAVQRDVDPLQNRPSQRLTEFAEATIEELNDDQDKKKLLANVLAAGKHGELPAFTAILKAKPHKTYGDYFIFLIAVLEENIGSKGTVTILTIFADAGVDITKQLPTYSLEPLAAVAKFKSVVWQYRSLLSAGKVSEVDKQRVTQAIREAEMAIRGIEGPPRKPGQVKLASGGAGVAAIALWKTAAALAADDVTVIGVADDIAIPFVVIGAAILTGIAIFTSPKPEMLDYRPAQEKVNAALVLIALLIANAQRPKPKPEKTTDVMPLPVPKPEPEQPKRNKCTDPTGLTPSDPIPITWFKPIHDSFYPPSIEVRRGKLHGVIYRDDPNTKLPDGTPVGVKTQFWPRFNKVMQLIPERRKGKQAQYKQELADWGYNWGKTMQPDHVQDIDWEGPDVYGNLWPFESSTNQSAGASQNVNQKITFCLTPDGPAYKEVRLAWVKKFMYGRYFVIKKFLIHS